MANQDPKTLFNRANNAAATGPVLHVRFDGRSRDIAMEILDLGAGSSDAAVFQAVAAFLDVNVARFDGMVIERHQNGNMTLRPEAVFG
jgi:hypothetical protein